MFAYLTSGIYFSWLLILLDTIFSQIYLNVFVKDIAYLKTQQRFFRHVAINKQLSSFIMLPLSLRHAFLICCKSIITVFLYNILRLNEANAQGLRF